MSPREPSNAVEYCFRSTAFVDDPVQNIRQAEHEYQIPKRTRQSYGPAEIFIRFLDRRRQGLTRPIAALKTFLFIFFFYFADNFSPVIQHKSDFNLIPPLPALCT